MRIIVFALTLGACVSTTPVRVTDSGLVIGDDSDVSTGTSDAVEVKRESRLVIERKGARDTFEAPVSLRRRPGLLEVDEPFGRREYPDPVVERVSIETPDHVGTGLLIGTGVVLAIAGIALWINTLATIGEL